MSDSLLPCGLYSSWNSLGDPLEGIPFSRGSSQPRDWTQVSRIAGGFFIVWATRGALSCLPGALATKVTLFVGPLCALLLLLCTLNTKDWFHPPSHDRTWWFLTQLWFYNHKTSVCMRARTSLTLSLSAVASISSELVHLIIKITC